MRISDLARRSGFSPSTLRYYETVGLLPDPVRTESGYRVYDDDAVERLAFIARAKGLGLSLTEVSELVELWADGPCPPARDRLQALVEAKVGEVRGRLGQLATLAAQLEHLLRSLAAIEPADRCGPGCACDAALSGPAAAPAPSPVPPEASTPTPAFTPSPAPAPAPVPVGCTLSPAAATDRTADWASLVAHATERTRTADGLRLRLPADASVVARAGELAVLEVGCCAFFRFALTIDAGGVWLDVAAPEDARPLLEGFV